MSREKLTKSASILHKSIKFDTIQIAYVINLQILEITWQIDAIQAKHNLCDSISEMSMLCTQSMY